MIVINSTVLVKLFLSLKMTVLFTSSKTSYVKLILFKTKVKTESLLNKARNLAE